VSTALKIVYARVPTEGQDVTAQRNGLETLGVEAERIYVDHGLTGTNRSRPGLGEALAACRAGDMLVISRSLVQQRRDKRHGQRLGLRSQVRRRLNRCSGAPPGHNARSDVAERCRRDPDGAYGQEFVDLDEHRVQAHVARRLLERCEQRSLAVWVACVVVIGREQHRDPLSRVVTESGDDPRSQRLLAHAQRRPHDAVDAARRRRLDPLAATARQQLVAHALMASLALGVSKPPGELLRVGHRALAEAELLADLRPMALDRSTRPLVRTRIRSVDPQLTGDEVDHRVWKIRGPGGKAAVARVGSR
jgi:hypothetical protein